MHTTNYPIGINKVKMVMSSENNSQCWFTQFSLNILLIALVDVVTSLESFEGTFNHN